MLYAALSGTFGTTYLGAVEDADRRVTQSVQAMRAGVAFALMGMALWLVTWIQGISWCCSARRITRKTDRVDEEDGIEIGGVGKVSEDN